MIIPFRIFINWLVLNYLYIDPILSLGQLLTNVGNQFTITAGSVGISTVTSPNANFKHQSVLEQVIL